MKLVPIVSTDGTTHHINPNRVISVVPGSNKGTALVKTDGDGEITSNDPLAAIVRAVNKALRLR
jgi:hypothetical protein